MSQVLIDNLALKKAKERSLKSFLDLHKIKLRDDPKGIIIDDESPTWFDWMREHNPQGAIRYEGIIRWLKVKAMWADAQELEQAWNREVAEKPTRAEAAVSFAKSMVSRGLFSKRVDSKVRSLRILSCHGDATAAPCPSRSYSAEGKYHFCNDCLCGERELARLSSVGSTETNAVVNEEDYSKLDYPYLACPRKRPGFSNES